MWPILRGLAWDVEATDTFIEWYKGLTDDETESVNAVVDLLEEQGVYLGYPRSSKVVGSRPPEMRELRIQHEGRPYRILYAFDPRRTAILLLGGDKTGDDRWYERMVPVADRLYDEHLATL